MDSLTLTAENGLLGHLFGTEFTVTAPIQVALLTALGTETDPGVEVTGGGYARQDFTPTLASSGYVFNATDMEFNAPTATIVGLEIWDSANHRLWHGPLSEPIIATVGDQVFFASGSITIRMGGETVPRTVTVTTTEEANLSTWAGLVDLGLVFRVLRVECDKPARVRLYSTYEHLSADLSRAIGTPLSGDHGLILEYVADETHLAADLDPHAEGADLGEPPTGDIWMAVQNRSGSTGSVTVSLRHLRLEGDVVTDTAMGSWPQLLLMMGLKWP